MAHPWLLHNYANLKVIYMYIFVKHTINLQLQHVYVRNFRNYKDDATSISYEYCGLLQFIFFEMLIR